MIDLTTTTPFKAFYSDPHFGHHNIIKFCDRPFINKHHMMSELVLNYNKLIGEDDWVCWVGDCVFGSALEGRQILDKMNGHKVLVRGNHDGSYSKCLNMGFALVVEEMRIMIKDRVCVVNHYPYAPSGDLTKADKYDIRYLDRRPKRIKNQLLIHGHTHSAEKFGDGSVHVGVDAWNYGPAMMDEVSAIIEDL